MKFKLVLVACAVAIASAFLACGQGKGQRCQINSDCDSNLCSTSTGVCTDLSANGNIDATVPDAAIDAKPDAVPDAF
ncbi:hypothetical protein BH11MYX1_BH11MYX1_37920 [soil metagenome]